MKRLDNTDPFVQPISKEIWGMKYQHKNFDGSVNDEDVYDTWWRIAKGLAINEAEHESRSLSFYQDLYGFKFLPAGRITSGTGTGRNVTLMNCYVMNKIEDSMTGIFDTLKESALTMQQGGGIGMDFSTIRPKGAEVKGVAADASGPLSFMEVWDSMCKTVMSAGSRRGAMMATMRCDHPDVEAFIDAKLDRTKFRMFNLSVLVTDAFMEAVSEDSDWNLVFGGKVYKTMKARDLWNKIMQGTYEKAEPGVIFIDRIMAKNNLEYCEEIIATNPCGEVPLPPYGACLLGSINVPMFVLEPFTEDAHIDYDDVREAVFNAVRMMDNVIDVTNYPLPEQKAEALAKRRIGLGVTGIASTLAMMRLKYGSQEARDFVDNLMSKIADYAYMASAALAKERGSFPLYDKEEFDPKVKLSQYVRDTVKEWGIRNGTVLSIAPTGTISLYANNVSSGIEPIFAIRYKRKVLLDDGSHMEQEVKDYAVWLFEHLYPGKPLPDYFQTVADLTPEDHVLMQATVQKYVCQSISKTVNLPEDISFADFSDVYMKAYYSGCKGCTTYRPNSNTGSILSVSDDSTGGDESMPVDTVSEEGAACTYDESTGRYTCDQ